MDEMSRMSDAADFAGDVRELMANWDRVHGHMLGLGLTPEEAYAGTRAYFDKFLAAMVQA